MIGKLIRCHVGFNMTTLETIIPDCFTQIVKSASFISQYLLGCTSHNFRSLLSKSRCILHTPYPPKDVFVYQIILENSLTIFQEIYNNKYYNLDDSIWKYAINKKADFIGAHSSAS